VLVAVEGYGKCPKTEKGRTLAKGAATLLHTPEELFSGKLLEGKDFDQLDELCK
jgi:hypothetical protein